VDGAQAGSLYFHLKELRSRLIKCAVPVLFFAPFIFTQSGTVFETLVKIGPPDTQYVVYAVTEPFMLKVKLSLTLSFVACLPWIVIQLSNFVLPGLYANERFIYLTSVSAAFVCAAVSLYLSGARFIKSFMDFSVAISGFGHESHIGADRFFGFVCAVTAVCAVVFTAAAILLLFIIHFIYKKYRGSDHL